MTKNVLISGLTAAGKTTHAKLTSQEKQLGYFSSSKLLLEKYGVNTKELSNEYWVSKKGQELLKKRSSQSSIDKWVDEKTIESLSNLSYVFFDSWGAPWFSSKPCLRIRLESSLKSRVWKAMISFGSNSNRQIDEVFLQLQESDDWTRKYFLNSYGFDIFNDLDIFNYIIDISSFISNPEPLASFESINKTQEIISSIVGYYLNSNLNDLTKIKSLVEKHGKNIFIKYPNFVL